MSWLSFVEHGPAARTALLTLVGDTQRDDPLAPVTVVVPSTYAGLGLRRALAAPRGLVNVRFLVLDRLAELLGAPALAAQQRRPLTEPLRFEAVRAVLAERPDAFAAVAHHPATERGLADAFAELRRSGSAAVAALEKRDGPAGAAARLYLAFRRRTESFYDEEDLAAAAAGAAVSGAAALREIGHVVVFLPVRLSPAEVELVRALRAVGRLDVLVGLTGDPTVDDVAREVASRLDRGAAGAASPQREMRPPSGTQLLSAPDPEDEARAVVRLVLERAASGTPLHRMAVLYLTEEPYARLARALLDAGGIPWSGPSTRTLADSTAGRVLLGTLRLIESDFRRNAIVEWLASGPVLEPAGGRPVPAARWDTLSRQAGVVGGLRQWQSRLDRFARRVQADLDAAGHEDLSEGARLHLTSDLDLTRRLAVFVADLGRRLVPPDPATWPAFARWARGLLAVYLGGEGRRREWPEAELDAARRVNEALDALDVLVEIRPDTALSTFRRALEATLAVPLGRVGRFGTGVFVGRLRHAYGGDFDVVHVLGMAEGAFPPRERDDPILPDRDRQATDGALPLHARRRAEQRRDYLAALAAAPQRILSFPRADPRAHRKRLPARWLLDSAELLAGRTLGADELARLQQGDWCRVVPSFEAGVTASDQPASLSERDVRGLTAWRRAQRPLARHPLVHAVPALAAGVDAIQERSSDRLTRFDGLVDPANGLVPDTAMSPTALEAWATCPFRYLMARVLRLRDIERPEETETITPLERGSLVHGVLQEFLDLVEPRTSPEQPWSEAERELLAAVAERHCDAAEAEGLTGRRLTWQLERRRILRELRAFLETDEQQRARLGVVPLPHAREIAFGLDGNGDTASEPLVLRLPAGRAVTFHGRIDRVDAAPTGSPIVVFDYKTGRSRDDPRAGLEQGTRLQLPVYALAMERLHPGADVHAYYWYVADRTGKPLAGYRLDDEHRALFVDRVATIVSGIDGGVFPAYPGEPRADARGRDTWHNCCYCPFDRICPSARDRVWERKSDDAAVGVFLELSHADDEAGRT